MFLKIEKENVIEGLPKAANIIPSKSGAAYLRSIWLKSDGANLSVLCTDSNIEFCGRYAADITEPGLVGVQGKAFVELLRKLPPGTVTLKMDAESGNLLVEQGKRKYKLPTHDSSWFQDFSAFPEDRAVFWSGDFLQELIDKLNFCIGDEDSLEAIACLYMKPVEDKFIEACGLNGHQFAMLRFTNDDLHALLPQQGILIQKRYLAELKKWLGNDEIEMNIGEKRLYLRTADKKESFSLPLSAYDYPDYHNFLGKLNDPGRSEMKAPRQELLQALDRISIFNTDNNRCANFDLGAELTLSALGQDIGSASESMEVQFNGELKKIAFPTKDLIEVFNHFVSDEVKMVLTGSEGPCGITGKDDAEYTVIIMPMKIVEDAYYNEEEV